MSAKFEVTKNKLKQAGAVSIMVTIILMIVISLVVLGFAQLSRRNSRQALDQQLNQQAFYAAETGVNDAAALIKEAVEGGSTIPSKTGCDDSGTGGFYSSLVGVGSKAELDDSANVEYTCLLVDPTPNTLRYDDIGMDSIVVPINPESSIDELTLTWQTKEETTTPTSGCPGSANGQFSPTDDWDCGYGVLRFDLVPTAGNSTAQQLQDNTMTSFLVPLSSGGQSFIGFSPSRSNSNNRVGAQCSNSGCSMDIRSLGAGQYHMRISSLYKNVSLSITASSGGDPVGLTGAQAVIDATGKAQDVLRRIQVYLPLTVPSLHSDYAIQSTDSICKRYSVMTGFFESQAGAESFTSNPLCE